MLRFRAGGRRRYVAIAAALPAAIVSVLAFQAPRASAAAGPVITSGSCGVTSYYLRCEVAWSGGTAPTTARWAAISGSSIGATQASGQESVAEGNCVPDGFYEVKVTVTDAAGLSASTFLGGYCDA
jgi:hypothetical protein